MVATDASKTDTDLVAYQANTDSFIARFLPTVMLIDNHFRYYYIPILLFSLKEKGGKKKFFQ